MAPPCYILLKSHVKFLTCKDMYLGSATQLPKTVLAFCILKIASNQSRLKNEANMVHWLRSSDCTELLTLLKSR